MNNYINNTIYAYKNEGKYDKIDIRKLKKVLELYYDDVNINILEYIMYNNTYIKQNNIKLSFTKKLSPIINSSLYSKYIKMTLYMKDFYYNLYFPIKYNIDQNICNLINDVILYLNILKNTKENNFNFQKDIGFNLSLRTRIIACRKKYYSYNIKMNFVNYKNTIEEFVFEK